MIMENAAIYAKWNEVIPGTFSVKFETDGGDAVATQAVKEGENAKKPEKDPTKEGHTFGGWFADKDCKTAFDFEKTAITKETTVYAKWTVLEYKVEFIDATVDAQTVKHGDTAKKPEKDPTKDGVKFGGWYEDDKFAKEFDFTGAIKADTKIYAKWVKLYKITFDSDGGSVVAEIKDIEEGTTATKPADPTKEGSTFKGWLNGTTPFDWATKITADLTLKASWEVSKFTVTFEGVEEPTGIVTVNYGDKVPTDKIPAVPEKAGYENGTWDWVATEEIKADKTVKAKYTAIKYTINYVYATGAAAPTKANPTEYTVEDTVKLNYPTVTTSNYFSKWYEDAAHTIKANGIAKGTTGIKTFYASNEFAKPESLMSEDFSSGYNYENPVYAPDRSTISYDLKADAANGAAGWVLEGKDYTGYTKFVAKVDSLTNNAWYQAIIKFNNAIGTKEDGSPNYEKVAQGPWGKAGGIITADLTGLDMSDIKEIWIQAGDDNDGNAGTVTISKAEFAVDFVYQTTPVDITDKIDQYGNIYAASFADFTPYAKVVFTWTQDVDAEAGKIGWGAGSMKSCGGNVDAGLNLGVREKAGDHSVEILVGDLEPLFKDINTEYNTSGVNWNMWPQGGANNTRKSVQVYEIVK